MNKLVDDYNNTYHCSIGKKPVDANYSAFSEKNESSHKTAKCKVGDRGLKISPKLVKRNTNSWTSKIKDLNVETTIGSFYGKEVLLSKS